MANRNHFKLLEEGVNAWNQWREQKSEIVPDLSGLRISGLNLSGANFSGANLRKIVLKLTDLVGTNLSGADLRSANLSGANLRDANLSGADLRGANLYSTNLNGADLTCALLVETNISKASLIGCHVYGISAWNLKSNGSKQSDMVITPVNEPTIKVDNLETAQFIYLVLNNQRIKDAIDSLTAKIVLILGRFTSERKLVLDAIKKELRKDGYLPVLFDFEKPVSRNLTESVIILASLSRFIIADITEAKSLIHELQLIVPTFAIPVQPLQEIGKERYGIFEHFRTYPWVLPIYQYTDCIALLASFEEMVIAPAESKKREMEIIKSEYVK